MSKLEKALKKSKKYDLKIEKYSQGSNGYENEKVNYARKISRVINPAKNYNRN